MQLRIRLRQGPQLKQKRNASRRVALALSALLTPAALMAFALAFWRFGADMNWTGRFAIPDGLFSHWQVWGAVGVAMEVCAVALARYGRGRGAGAP
ncbi:MAG: hypothetical protein Q8N47_05090 [Bryobacterales bacterium]|nr:hypothetical protein [Bryobacterales bacterium]